MNIPTVALIDSNTDPNIVDFQFQQMMIIKNNSAYYW